VRGDIYRYRPHDSHGHKQSGVRYAVIVQSDALMLSTVIAAPTSTSARPTMFRPRIVLNGTPTLVMVEQTAVVDPEAELGDFAGRLSADELADVDRALRMVLGLF